MNKAELVAALSQRCSIPKEGASSFLETLATIVSEQLKAGEEVPLPGLGKLKPHETPARKGRNPKTGEAIDIPAKTVAKFSASSELKNLIA